MGEIIVALLSGGTIVIAGIFMKVRLKHEIKNYIENETEQ